MGRVRRARDVGALERERTAMVAARRRPARRPAPPHTHTAATSRRACRSLIDKPIRVAHRIPLAFQRPAWGALGCACLGGRCGRCVLRSRERRLGRRRTRERRQRSVRSRRLQSGLVLGSAAQCAARPAQKCFLVGRPSPLERFRTTSCVLWLPRRAGVSNGDGVWVGDSQEVCAGREGARAEFVAPGGAGCSRPLVGERSRCRRERERGDATRKRLGHEPL